MLREENGKYGGLAVQYDFMIGRLSVWPPAKVKVVHHWARHIPSSFSPLKCNISKDFSHSKKWLNRLLFQNFQKSRSISKDFFFFT